MNQKTREAVIGQDLNRIGPPHRLPTHQGASLKPRGVVREAPEAPDAVQAVVDKVMRQMAAEKAAEAGSDRESVERKLMAQVSGLTEVCRD